MSRPSRPGRKPSQAPSAPKGARESFFVTAAPGTEPLLHAELAELRLAKLERQVGGCYFEGTLTDALRVNLWARTAVRVLMRVARFDAPDEDRLHAGVEAVAWERFLGPEGSLAVDARASQSALDHTLYIAQRTKDAICDRFRTRHGTRPNVDREEPDLAVHVHLSRDRCTLLVDTSGPSLHKRGWRRAQVRAPLAETLAAALVLHSPWDRRQPLVDLFCGSGTILIEAALIAANHAPGLFRERFAFERFPEFDPAAWQALQAAARAAVRPTPKLVLLGRDRDPRAIKATLANAEAAGLADRIHLEVGEALDFEPRPGWNAAYISNPPYGERIGRDLPALAHALGTHLTEKARGSHVTLLIPRGASPHFALPNAKEHPTLNGGIECSFLSGSLD